MPVARILIVNDDTDLGLATVRRVLGSYGGSVTVQSQPDAGSAFIVTFPKDAA